MVTSLRQAISLSHKLFSTALNEMKSKSPFSLLLAGVLAVTSSGIGAGFLDDWAKMKSIIPQSYVCYRATEKIKIDGRLDEPSWQATPWTQDFVDIEGDVKPRPKFRTRAKMLWDEEYFYVAAELEEPHVWATLTNHDAVIFH